VEVVRVTPFSDKRVHDRIALDEIDLYSEMIIAASLSEGPLTPKQIDAALGLAGRPVTGKPTAHPVRPGRSGRGGLRSGPAARSLPKLP
jgi:hypothetical protein